MIVRNKATVASFKHPIGVRRNTHTAYEVFIHFFLLRISLSATLKSFRAFYCLDDVAKVGNKGKLRRSLRNQYGYVVIPDG